MANLREAVVEAVRRNAEDIRFGRSDWRRIANLFILWLDENQNTKSFDNFVWYIENKHPEWIRMDSPWEPFFDIPSRKKELMEFIKTWVAKEDIRVFKQFLKKEDKDLWLFLTDRDVKPSYWYY